MGLVLKLGNRSQKNCETHNRKYLDCFKRLLDIWLLKEIQVRYEEEIKNRLLKIGRKIIFVIELAELYFAFGGKVKLVTDELGYLTEEISKQSVQGEAWFLLAACSKMQEKRDNLRKEPLSKKKKKKEQLEEL